jgi:hypothetical protein
MSARPLIELKRTRAPRRDALVRELAQGPVRSRPGWRARSLCALGAVLVGASGGIHFHLWATGYNAIPKIGPLFLAQSISAFVLAAWLVIRPSLLVATAALGLAAGTIAGFLVTVWFGLFGFTDSFSAPYASVALITESVAVAVLAGGCVVLIGQVRRRPGPTPPRTVEP